MSRRLVAGMLALLLGLQLFALLRAPALWLPATIAIRLDRAGEVMLDATRLAAAQADGLRVAFRRGSDGAWRIRAEGEGRPPLLRRDGEDERLGTVKAAALRSFQVGAQAFTDIENATGTVSFAAGHARWRHDGASVYRDGVVQPDCPDATLSARSVALWNRAAPRALTIARPLVFGGNLHCGNRVGIGGVEPGSAQFSRHGSALLFSGIPGTAANDASLRDEERSLHGVDALVLGRTRYDVALQGDVLTLAPTRRVMLHAVPEMTLPAQVTVTWRQRALWNGSTVGWTATIAAAGALFLVACLAPGTARRRGNILGPLHQERRLRSRLGALAAALHGPAALLVLAAGIASLLLQRTGEPPSAACSLLLAAIALATWLVLPARTALPPAAAAALVLLAAGLLCQLNLGLGGPDTEWLRYYRKTAALLAIGSAAIALCRFYGGGLRISQRRVEWLLAGLAGCALLALAAQVLWGDETGVFDMQPVELAKLALTLLTAHCLALRMGWRADHRTQPGHGARWLRLIAPALLFLALLGCALVQVDDYSPLLLLAMWSGAMLLAYALSARRWLTAAMLACVAMGGVAGVTALREAAPSTLPASFYGDRFQVWLEPARHPHTGQQLQQGAAAIAAGGWFGADHLLGLRSLGQPAGSVLALPAVQDDFAPAFLLQRHGLLAGLLLWCAQAALVAGLVEAAIRCGRAGTAASGFRQAWLLRLQAFTLGGGAAFVAGHLLLSWGTNLAILPVMGQPMSFLSAGGSHLLFFLLPLLGMHSTTSVTDSP